MRTKRELNQSLGEQVVWLRASALSFDAGSTSESKRTAVAIRTLVHDTASSRGLLGQLKMRDRMTWLSSVQFDGTGFTGPPWLESPHEPGFEHLPGMPQFTCTFDQWWRGRLFEFNGSDIDRA